MRWVLLFLFLYTAFHICDHHIFPCIKTHTHTLQSSKKIKRKRKNDKNRKTWQMVWWDEMKHFTFVRWTFAKDKNRHMFGDALCTLDRWFTKPVSCPSKLKPAQQRDTNSEKSKKFFVCKRCTQMKKLTVWAWNVIDTHVEHIFNKFLIKRVIITLYTQKQNFCRSQLFWSSAEISGVIWQMPLVQYRLSYMYNSLRTTTLHWFYLHGADWNQ